MDVGTIWFKFRVLVRLHGGVGTVIEISEWNASLSPLPV